MSMHEQWRNTKVDKPDTTFNRIEKLHPHKMFMYLSILGSGLIFLFLVFAYLVNIDTIDVFKEHHLPKPFTISTFLLLFSSYTVSRVVPNYQKDRISKMVIALGLTLFVGILFVICQYLGWRELEVRGVYLTNEVSGAYLYLIFGLHILHVMICLTVLSVIFLSTWRTSKDAVKSLIFFTNPYQRIKLEMLATYWHFLDFSWFILFFIFFFTF